MNKKLSAREFIARYEELKESEKTTFSRIVNKLLQVNYLTVRKTADANDYRIILAYEELFASFLALMDFELNIVRADEVIYIINEANFNHLRLKKLESIMVLVIRLIYQDKKDYVTLNEDVEIALLEIHEKLQTIGFLDNKRVTKNELKPALMMLKGYNIIDYIDRDLRDDARIKIYPTILYITKMDTINHIVNRLDEYLKAGENEEINEN